VCVVCGVPYIGGACVLFRLSVGSSSGRKCEPIVSERYRYVGGVIAATAAPTVVTALLLLFLMH